MADGQMTQSTYIEIDGLPARVTALETTAAAIPTTYQTLTAAAKQDAALVDCINSGAKNMLNAWNAPAQTQPINGITWTIGNDGTVTANGTATANSWFYLIPTNSNINYGCETVLTGCPEGGSSITWEIQISQVGGSTKSDTGSGITQPASFNYKYIACGVRNGQHVDNLIFKPMVCAKSVHDITPDFVAYSPSNAELFAMIRAMQ